MCQNVRGVDLEGKPNDSGLPCPECCPWVYQGRTGYKYWLIAVWGDVEPALVGPYKSEGQRDREALLLRQKEGDKHGIFWMNTSRNKPPDIGSYSGGFMALAESSEDTTIGGKESS
jgi:hypothetical protein